MARNKMKNSKTVSFRLRNDICEELEKYSEETMLSKTAIVEKALEDYFKGNICLDVKKAPKIYF